MKSLKLVIFLAFTLTLSARAQEARFFRICGPVVSTIIGFSGDCYVTWTNTATNATFTVQTASSLISPVNWVDYVQVPATGPITTLQLCDLNPHSGMAFIPAGSFWMGNCMATNEGSAAELPLHSVYISAFYMDKYHVTKALWDSVYQWATNNGYSFVNAGSGKAANHPVQSVNWYDTVKWCNARSQKEGLSPCYYTTTSQTTLYKNGELVLSNACVKWNANGYRLPTEAEWEKAARGGASGRRFPWGNLISTSFANYTSVLSPAYDLGPYLINTNFTCASECPPYTSPVGYFTPNGYGLYDMAGNVSQWCWDRYDASWYSNAGATQSDTCGPDIFSALRVMRGGDWQSYASSPRCANRIGDVLAVSYVGFRCVRGF